MRWNIILFFLLGTTSLLAQADFSGNWIGTITQDKGGYRPEYQFEMYLQQDGNYVWGRSYVYIDKIYAMMELRGTIVNGNTLVFEESSIVNHKEIEGMEWCLKTGKLNLRKFWNTVRLEGDWQGNTSFSDCIPGNVYLKHQIPRA